MQREDANLSRCRLLAREVFFMVNARKARLPDVVILILNLTAPQISSHPLSHLTHHPSLLLFHISFQLDHKLKPAHNPIHSYRQQRRVHRQDGGATRCPRVCPVPARHGLCAGLSGSQRWLQQRRSSDGQPVSGSQGYTACADQVRRRGWDTYGCRQTWLGGLDAQRTLARRGRGISIHHVRNKVSRDRSNAATSSEGGLYIPKLSAFIRRSCCHLLIRPAPPATNDT